MSMNQQQITNTSHERQQSQKIADLIDNEEKKTESTAQLRNYIYVARTTTESTFQIDTLLFIRLDIVSRNRIF